MSSHRIRIWTRSSILEEATARKENPRHGAAAFERQLSSKDSSRISFVGGGGSTRKFQSGSHATTTGGTALSDDEDDDEFGWGWVIGTMLSKTPEMIKFLVEDEDCIRCRGMTVDIPSDLVKEDDILMVNGWASINLDGEEVFDEAEASPPDNLINLTHLHEPAVVHCLRKRYEEDLIYTATGPILLAVNPFRRCGKLYSDEMMDKYWNKETKEDGCDKLEPHVFKSADLAFNKMMKAIEYEESSRMGDSSAKRIRKRKSKANIMIADQSILVSGESGSGKTVTTKFIMKYLATVSERIAKEKGNHESIGIKRDDQRTKSANKGSNSSKGSIEQKIIQSNPILESFGNARTVRNDNSSRFGKFIEMRFQTNGTLIGAAINTYLLEKIRLIKQSASERNYHIFYEILDGAESSTKDALFLEEDALPEDFKMTSQSGTYDRRDGVEDVETYEDLMSAFDTLGFSSEEVDGILQVTAAVLHLSNVPFIAINLDESRIDTDDESLAPGLELLGVSQQPFNDALCYTTIEARGEKHKRNMNKEQAERGLEALVKATYSALFDYLVERINSLIASDSSLPERNKKSQHAAFIGVLDIFGFESFESNSFEQLCINYCNEALQQQFNFFVFKNEQEEYNREGIKWSFISFPDNQDALDLIDKRGSGIMSLLDSYCKTPGATDKTFSSDLYKTCKAHQRFSVSHSQKAQGKFSIRHYAGEVIYTIEGFVEKNKDDLPKEALELLMSSANPFVNKLSKVIAPLACAKSKRLSVGGQFSSQLRELRDKVDNTSPHYIRCLKPNDELIPDNFIPKNIADQLRCAGVIEAVRVSRVGFPQRFLHAIFLQRYGILDNEWKKKKNIEQRCDCLVKTLQNKVGEGVQLGTTKVFLRSQAFETLESWRGEVMQAATIKLQACARGFMARASYRTALFAIVKIQCLIRMHFAIVEVEERRRNKAATTIVAYYRRADALRKYQKTMFVAIWAQNMHRAHMVRKRYTSLNQERKCRMIQTAWRRHHYSNRYKKMKVSTIAIQCFVRCRKASQELRKLRMGARDLDAIRCERDALKEEVDNLKMRLKQVDSEAVKKRHNENNKEVERLKREVEASNAAYKDLESKNQHDSAQSEKRLKELQLQLQESNDRALEEAQKLQVKCKDEIKHQNELNELKQEMEGLKVKLQESNESALEEARVANTAYKELEMKFKVKINYHDEELEQLKFKLYESQNHHWEENNLLTSCLYSYQIETQLLCHELEKTKKDLEQSKQLLVTLEEKETKNNANILEHDRLENKLKAESEKYQSELQQLKVELQENNEQASKKAQQAENAYKDLEVKANSELEHYRKKVELLEMQLGESKSCSLESSQVEAETLRKELNENKKVLEERDELLFILDDKEGEIENLSHDIVKYKKKIKSLQKSNDEQEKQLIILAESLYTNPNFEAKKLEREVERLRRESQEAKKMAIRNDQRFQEAESEIQRISKILENSKEELRIVRECRTRPKILHEQAPAAPSWDSSPFSSKSSRKSPNSSAATPPPLLDMIGELPFPQNNNHDDDDVEFEDEGAAVVATITNNNTTSFEGREIIARPDLVSLMTMTEVAYPHESMSKLRNQVQTLSQRLDNSSYYSAQMAKDIRTVLEHNMKLTNDLNVLKANMTREANSSSSNNSNDAAAADRNLIRNARNNIKKNERSTQATIIENWW